METKKFKCKDEVIYRVKTNYCEWTYGIFSHYHQEDDYEVAVVNGMHLYPSSYDILPYKGNEELVGRVDDPEEEVRLEEGEYLICFDNLNHFKAEDFCLSPFASIVESDVKTKDGCRWRLFIKLSDFNPNDMEETKKHILVVRNGKIIRYKG